MARRRQALGELHDSGDPRTTHAVLVVGTDDWGIQQAVEQLEAAGITTRTCHPIGEPAFPCNALVDGRVCPLDAGFDLVITVRARPDAVPAAGEFGVVCALHEHVPLITAGIAGRNPFEPWATRAVGRGDDLVAVVQEIYRDREMTEIDLRPTAAVSGAGGPAEA